MPDDPSRAPPTPFGDEDDDLAPAPEPLPALTEEEEDELAEEREDEPRRWDTSSAAAMHRRGVQRRRGPWRLLALLVVALAVVGAAAYIVTTPHPADSPAGGGGGGCTSSCGTTVTDYVVLGTPTSSSTTCGEGGQVSVEEIPWEGATAPLTTANVFLEITEIVDGDIVGASSGAAFASRGNLCPGAPPSPSFSWYIVLQDAAGANLMTFCYAQGWAYIGPGPSSVPLVNGTALYLVINPSLAGQGYELDVGGTEGGPDVSGGVDL